MSLWLVYDWMSPIPPVIVLKVASAGEDVNVATGS